MKIKELVSASKNLGIVWASFIHYQYRCFVFSIEGNPSEKQIYNHAKNQMNTSGRTTSVFYFDEYNYKDITLSNSYNETFTFCLNLNWKYRFDKYPNGKESFYRLEGDNAIQVNL